MPLAVADLRHRYAGSVLGGAWAILGPLVEVLAYVVIFGLLLRPPTAREGIAYALFVASGLLPWAAFREALEGSAHALAEHRWIRRSRVPFELLVAKQVVVSGARGAIGVALVLAAVIVTQGPPDVWGFVMPWVGLYLQVATTYGLGLLLAPLGVLHPDLRPALSSVLTLLTFASPIVYPETVLEGAVGGVMALNPFTHLLRFYRFPLLTPGSGLDAVSLAVALATPVAAVAAGTLLHRRLWWPARDRL